MRETVPQVVKRADEITELAALWWKLHPDTHLPHNMEKGLRACWTNFGAFALAKYDRDGAVKLRDVMRLTHPKAVTEEQNTLYKRVIDRELDTPDTWEVELSASTDKKSSWERLLRDNKLGGLALLRNLRNMHHADVDQDLIRRAISSNQFRYVLPFRFTAAARIMPIYEKWLDLALLEKVNESPEFTGRTVVMVDVSGSMDAKLSAKSDLPDSLSSMLPDTSTMTTVRPVNSGDSLTFSSSARSSHFSYIGMMRAAAVKRNGSTYRN
jgi:hypothetical protein